VSAQHLAEAIDRYQDIARRPQHEILPPELAEELLRLDIEIGTLRARLGLTLPQLPEVPWPYSRLPGGGALIIQTCRGLFAYTTADWESDMAILRALALAGETPAAGPPVADEGTLSARDIARMFPDRTYEAVEGALRRFAKTHKDCRIQVENHCRADAHYLYRLADVMPHLKRLYGKPAAPPVRRPKK
jgi:hypothetical protein